MSYKKLEDIIANISYIRLLGRNTNRLSYIENIHNNRISAVYIFFYLTHYSLYGKRTISLHRMVYTLYVNHPHPDTGERKHPNTITLKTHTPSIVKPTHHQRTTHTPPPPPTHHPSPRAQRQSRHHTTPTPRAPRNARTDGTRGPRVADSATTNGQRTARAAPRTEQPAPPAQPAAEERTARRGGARQTEKPRREGMPAPGTEPQGRR